ncbi:MAG TPA: LptF/LptG family permease, partial [Bacteroidetes bacterium]|nr:LptF/LptG family permease [Bacteroidota bacterium]
KDVFTKTMLNLNLFKFPDFNTRKREKENIKIDSTKEFRPREILSELIKEKQEHAIDLAITYAKSAKKNVDDSQRSIVWRAKTIKRYEIEWQRKFTLSFACFIFFFIGAPLGAIIRKGGLGTPVVVSVLFFVVYYVISLMGEKFAREMIFTPFEGMWASSFILLPLGIFLTYKATTDSVIMNTETYTEIPKQIIRSIKKIMIKKYPGDRVNENPSTDK